MKFIGIDLSLTGTGFTCLDDNTEIQNNIIIKTKPSMEIEDRIKLINDTIIMSIDKYKNKIIYIEALSLNSKGSAIVQLAGLHYFLRVNLKNILNVKFKLIPPATLKKFVTGKGNAKKELILLEVYKRWGVSFSNNNLADSYSLARMALDERLENI